MAWQIQCAGAMLFPVAVVSRVAQLLVYFIQRGDVRCQAGQMAYGIFYDIMHFHIRFAGSRPFEILINVADFAVDNPSENQKGTDRDDQKDIDVMSEMKRCSGYWHVLVSKRP